MRKEIGADTLDVVVPSMILQPLVENAIKHGISRQVAGGVVRVISDFKSDYHLLAVQNTGQLKGSGTQGGFGISSTKDRLKLLYVAPERFSNEFFELFRRLAAGKRDPQVARHGFPATRHHTPREIAQHFVERCSNRFAARYRGLSWRDEHRVRFRRTHELRHGGADGNCRLDTTQDVQQLLNPAGAPAARERP